MTFVPPRLADGAEVRAGQLPRGLDRFRPAGGEEHAVQVAGRERREPGRELDRGRVGGGPDRVVGQPLGLGRGGLGQLPAAMADLHDEQPRQAVEVALARVVEQVHAFAPDEHGMSRSA